MQIWLILLSAFSVTAAGIVILIDRYKTKRILNEIDTLAVENISAMVSSEGILKIRHY